jgi:hypothetical protein
MLYVPRMMKNLIFFSSLEDRGYVVSFQDGRVHIWPKDLKKTKLIGFMTEKLYRIKFEPSRALVSNACDMIELWHRRMVQLHHGSLIVLKEIVTCLPKFNIDYHKV